MDISDKNNKFKFTSGEKFPRKTKSKSIKRPPFEVQTMKVDKLPKPPQEVKQQKSSTMKNKKAMITRAFNNSKADQFVHVDYFYKESPVNFIVKTNLSDSILGKFVFNYFSTVSTKMDKNRVIQLIGLLNTWEKDIMTRLLSNRLITKLKYSFEPPVYRGPALGSTKVGDSVPNITNVKLITIGDSLMPLESHLIYLYFKYISLSSTCVHRNYFDFRLSNDWHEIDFQSLLAAILCCACPYLAMESFETPVNILKLSEYYYQRSQTLYSMIDTCTSSVNTCKIIIRILNTYVNYSSWADEWNKCYKMILSMNWSIDFTRSKDEILRTKPAFNTREFYLWEQNLFIWCTFNYYLTTALMSRIEIEDLEIDYKTPDILPALEALYDESSNSKWITSHEGRLCYYLFKSQNVFECSRMFSKEAYHINNTLSSPTKSQMEELYYIRQINNEWKNEFTKYCENSRFNQGQLAMAANLYLCYHFYIILCILPYIPRTASELKDPIKLKFFTNFMLNATSIAFLMDCQGTWMVIMGDRTKNLILLVAWGGVRICLKLFQDLDKSQLTSTMAVIKHLASVLNITLIKKLTTYWCFKFQKRINATITEKRSLLIFLAINQLNSLSNSNSNLKSTPTCNSPPKLDNYSKLKLLN